MPSDAIRRLVTAKKVDILRLLQREGCPLCHAVHDELERYWFWFFNESYGEASVAVRYIAFYGFCPKHAREIAQRGPAWPISVIYHWTLDNRLPSLRQVRQALDSQPSERSLMGLRDRALQRQLAAILPQGRCLLCVLEDETASRTVDDLLLVLAHDEETRQRFYQSYGLCMPHFFVALQHAQPDRLAGLRLIYDVQLERLTALNAELAEYFRKADYRFAHEPRGAEQTAWLRAAWRFAGGVTPPDRSGKEDKSEVDSPSQQTE